MCKKDITDEKIIFKKFNQLVYFNYRQERRLTKHNTIKAII